MHVKRDAKSEPQPLLRHFVRAATPRLPDTNTENGNAVFRFTLEFLLLNVFVDGNFANISDRQDAEHRM